MIIIGIDNGLDGGIAAVSIGGEVLLVRATPTAKPANGKTNRRLHYESEMVTILENLKSLRGRDGSLQAYIEFAQAMPVIRKGKPTEGVQGTASAFTFGVGHGLWRGMLAALGVPYTIVHPKTWQKEMFKDIRKVKDTKKASIITAGRLFPKVNLLPSGKARKESHGMSDALLMAEYGRRQIVRKRNDESGHLTA